MNCPKCQSLNVQPHLISEDKKSRNAKALLIAIIGCIAIPTLVALSGGEHIGYGILLGIIIAVPVVVVLKIVLTIIPARQKTIFVCADCGMQFKPKKRGND
ncbi:MAG: hypothetical protein J6D16_02040 [Clostridia bacterium]|nr:hypothetical protein [Clostridia bacterium]